MRVVMGMPMAAVIVSVRVAMTMIMALVVMPMVLVPMIVLVTLVVRMGFLGRVIVRHGAKLNG